MIFVTSFGAEKVKWKSTHYKVHAVEESRERRGRTHIIGSIQAKAHIPGKKGPKDTDLAKESQLINSPPPHASSFDSVTDTWTKGHTTP